LFAGLYARADISAAAAAAVAAVAAHNMQIFSKQVWRL
jgi:hypothetical protein